VPVGVGAGLAAVFGVILPFRADTLCRSGDELSATDLNGALACYRAAAELEPTNPLYLTRLGGALQLAASATPEAEKREGLWTQARSVLERACDLVPLDPYHHANLGRLLGERGASRAADAAWDAALRLDPDNPLLLSEAARTALGHGDTARARRLAWLGLAHARRFGPLHALLGLCSLSEGHPAEALGPLYESTAANWAGDGDGCVRALMAVAAANLALGRCDAAEPFARMAAEQRPRWPTTHFLLAQVREGHGDRELAGLAYRRVLQLDPGNDLARRALDRLETRRTPANDAGRDQPGG
jgi:tetratricopeptide (TPR) repeat protein